MDQHYFLKLLYRAETAETMDEALEILDQVRAIMMLEKSLSHSSGDSLV